MSSVLLSIFGASKFVVACSAIGLRTLSYSANATTITDGLFVCMVAKRDLQKGRARSQSDKSMIPTSPQSNLCRFVGRARSNSPPSSNASAIVMFLNTSVRCASIFAFSSLFFLRAGSSFPNLSSSSTRASCKAASCLPMSLATTSSFSSLALRSMRMLTLSTYDSLECYNNQYFGRYKGKVEEEFH